MMQTVKATVFYGDPYKNGGFQEPFEGSREELQEFVNSCEEYMWRQMGCNGNPYCYVEIGGLRLDRNLKIPHLPQTVAEFLNPPEGFKYSSQATNELLGIANGETESPRTVGSRLSARRKKYILGMLSSIPKNTFIRDLYEVLPQKSEAEFDEEELAAFYNEMQKSREFYISR